MEGWALLAQATDPEWWEGKTTILGYEFPYSPWVGIPALLVALLLAEILVEVVVGRWLGALASKSKSEVDDTFFEGVTKLVRPLTFLVALEALVFSLLEGEAKEMAGKALMVLAIVVIAFVVMRLLLSVVDSWVHSKDNLLPLGPPISLGIKIAFVPLVVLSVLHALNVEIIHFVTTLGVGSLAIALALQDTLANVFAGIQLVTDQPIRAGDFVEVDNKVRGHVFEIGLRSTKIRTRTNNMIIVPNSTLAKTVVINNDAFDEMYAHRFTLGVAYETDSRHAQRVLEEVLVEAGQKVEQILEGPHSVRFMEFGSSALIFRLEVRLRKYTGRRKPLSELHHMIHERFRKEGITIPFPIRTVYMQQPPADEPSAA